MAKSENAKPVSNKNNNATDINDKSVQNLTSSMAALTKQIEKNNAAMLVGSNTTKDINSTTIELQEHYDRQEKTLHGIASELKNSLVSTMKLSSTMASIGTVGFAAKLVKDMIDLDDTMTAVSVRMGKGTEGIDGLKKSVTNLQERFGTSYENAKNLVETLAKNKYIDNIEDAAAGIDLFSRASGLANGEVAELTVNLSKMGGLSTKEINAMYASMTKVQQRVGISEKGMQALSSTITNMTFNMSAFGKSSEDIKKMTISTTALVGAMEQVGISAQRSSQLVEQLTDPDRIEDNILLYSQLGISMEDAMSGNFDFDAMGPQFKEMAARIEAMGPVAGSSFAKSMGLSYKEVTKMAEMEANAASEIGEKAMTTEEEALGTLRNLENATEGLGKKLENLMNTAEGKLKNLPKVLLAALAIALPFVVKFGKKIWNKIVHKDEIQTSIAEAGQAGFASVEASAITSANGIQASISNAGRAGFASVVDSANGMQASVADSVKKVHSSVSDGITGSVSRFEESANNAINNVSERIPGVFGNTFKKVGDQAVAGTVKLGNIIMGHIGTWFESTWVGELFDGVDARIDALYARATKKNFVDTYFDASEMNLADTIEQQFGETDNYLDALEERLLNLGLAIDPQAFEEMRRDLEENSNFTVTFKDGKEHSDAEQKAAEVMSEQYKKALKHQRALEDLKMRSMGYDKATVEYLRVQEKNIQEVKEDKENQLKAEKELNEKVQNRIKLQQEEKKIQEQIKSLKKGGGNKDAAEALERQLDNLKKERSSLDESIKDSNDNIKSMEQKNADKYGRTSSGAVDYDNAINSQQNAYDAVKKEGEELKNKKEEDSNPISKLFTGAKFKIQKKMLDSELGSEIMDQIGDENIDSKKNGNGGISTGRKVGIAATKTVKAGAKGLAKGGLSILKGIGSGMGNLLKTVGPMAIVMKVVGKLIDKVQGPLEAMLDQVVEIFMPIVEALMPAISVLVDSVVNTITKKLLPPALSLLATIVDVLHWFLKPVVWILKALEHIPIIGGALAGIGEAIDTATGPETTQAMRDAAKSLKGTTFSMEDAAKSLEEGAEEESEEKEQEPEIIEASSGKFVSAGTTEMTTTVDKTTASLTPESSSSTDNASKTAAEEKRGEDNRVSIKEILNNTFRLESIDMGVQKLIDIMQTNNIIPVESPGQEWLSNPTNV